MIANDDAHRNADNDTHAVDNVGVIGQADPAPTEFKGVPYSEIIARWFALAGGEPVQGERNDKLHRLASHLRYIMTRIFFYRLCLGTDFRRRK